MAQSHILRIAGRQLARSSFTRPAVATTNAAVPRVLGAVRAYSAGHEESFEEFTARYEKEFDSVNDVFELQRNLNNAFAYDLVPSPSVIVAALRAARRVNDFPTAVRVFEGVKAKVENPQQYQEYLDELKPLREELGITLKEDLYPELS
ncbi:cytochrome c oxidase subunit VA-domain-containing protein [Peziza echinospora]|nr:cytochrome c oxidase subunit VA-domain-containing protein [Peziza echinospora]